MSWKRKEEGKGMEWKERKKRKGKIKGQVGEALVGQRYIHDETCFFGCCN